MTEFTDGKLIRITAGDCEDTSGDNLENRIVVGDPIEPDQKWIRYVRGAENWRFTFTFSSAEQPGVAARYDVERDQVFITELLPYALIHETTHALMHHSSEDAQRRLTEIFTRLANDLSSFYFYLISLPDVGKIYERTLSYRQLELYERIRTNCGRGLIQRTALRVSDKDGKETEVPMITVIDELLAFLMKAEGVI